MTRGSRRKNPVSLLQAARFERQMTQDQIVERLHEICPGHDGLACRVRANKLSTWEHEGCRPSPRHIESLCKLYRATAEDLGLVVWRTLEEHEQAAREERAQIEKDVRAQIEQQLRMAEVTANPAGLLLIPINFDPEHVATVRHLIALFQDGASPAWIRKRLNELRRGFET